MQIHLLDATSLFCLTLIGVGICIGISHLLMWLENKFNKAVSITVGTCIFFLFCLFLTALPGVAAQLHNYKVYYPSTCTFMSGKLDTWGNSHTNSYQYQVVCKEGGDISTYVSAPIKRWNTPARVNHIPAPIKGYIYVKEIK